MKDRLPLPAKGLRGRVDHYPWWLVGAQFEALDAALACGFLGQTDDVKLITKHSHAAGHSVGMLINFPGDLLLVIVGRSHIGYILLHTDVMKCAR